jgi:hypothetical protein
MVEKDEINPVPVKRFAQISLDDVDDMVVGSVPANTTASTMNWNTALVAYLNEMDGLYILPNPSTETTQEDIEAIENILSCFILAARKKDGTNYKANSLKVGIFALARQLKNDYDINFLSATSCVTKALDSRMKQLQAAGLGTTEHYPVFTEEQEKVI